MRMTLTLYSTDGCQLCDTALGLLRSMPELGNVEVEVVDIARDDGLVARYGSSIPVLRSGGRELAWPFNADAVLEMVDACRDARRKG